METSYIREFMMLAESKSYSRAAKALHLSQPALSRHIIALEEELGMQLFERSSRGVRLTEAGCIALDELGAIANRLDSLASRFTALANDNDGELRLEMLYYGAASRYGFPLVERFREAHPNTKLTLTSAQPQKIAEDLRTFKVDAGVTISFGLAAAGEFNLVNLGSEPLYAIMHKTHRWAANRELTVSELARSSVMLQEEEPEYSQGVLALLSQCGIAPAQIVYTPNVDTMPMSIAHTDHVFIGSKLLKPMSDDRLAFVRIQEPAFVVQFVLVTRADDDSPDVKRIRECASTNRREHAANI